jgi:hypothetical protein
MYVGLKDRSNAFMVTDPFYFGGPSGSRTRRYLRDRQACYRNTLGPLRFLAVAKASFALGCEPPYVSVCE